MSSTSDNEATPIRAGAVILASASLCPADPDLLWAPLGDQPLLAWSIVACLAVAALDPIILAVAPDRMAQANELLAALAEQAMAPDQRAPRWRVVTPIVDDPLERALVPGASTTTAPIAGVAPGGAPIVSAPLVLPRLEHAAPGSVALAGERRRDATLAGVQALAALAPACEWMVIHEATRPLASVALMRAGLAAAGRANVGAVAAEPVKETLKRAPDGVGGLVAETLPRAQLARAQTPQVYRVADLLAALHQLPPDADPADEATVAFAAGLPLVTYPGGHDNLRVTTRADLPIIASLASTPR